MSCNIHIPGIEFLASKESLGKLTEGIFLLKGAPGSGKTSYSKRFIGDNLNQKNLCIYINSSFTEKQFKNLFEKVKGFITNNVIFINPFLKKLDAGSGIQSLSPLDTSLDVKLALTLQTIESTISNWKSSGQDNGKKEETIKESKVFLVIDSLSHLFAIFNESDVLKFINALSFILKDNEATAIFTLTSSSSSSSLSEKILDSLSSLFDGTFEILVDEKNGILSRKIKLISSRTLEPKSYWIDFKIDTDGRIKFSAEAKFLICSLCKAPIEDEPKFYSELAFHSKHLEIYLKLVGAYGESRITDVGPSGVITGNFFFIDIVGLSDPSLSVRRQIEKIEVLNNLISSCNSFKKTSDKKILPTGDGMAIGFMENPALPLELSIEIHKKLQEYNQRTFGTQDNNSILGVRIGLASGSVFIVNDVNNNQNIWGPGIILARRVMDVGDDKHILIERGLAESLMALEDRYREIIKPLGNYLIKHGQVIKMYSAYSEDFGNPIMPSKFNTNSQYNTNNNSTI
jgi:KaiC/GvpD/RAD55 family RecA-like ATPase